MFKCMALNVFIMKYYYRYIQCAVSVKTLILFPIYHLLNVNEALSLYTYLNKTVKFTQNPAKRLENKSLTMYEFLLYPNANGQMHFRKFYERNNITL